MLLLMLIGMRKHKLTIVSGLEVVVLLGQMHMAQKLGRLLRLRLGYVQSRIYLASSLILLVLCLNQRGVHV